MVTWSGGGRVSPHGWRTRDFNLSMSTVVAVEHLCGSHGVADTRLSVERVTEDEGRHQPKQGDTLLSETAPKKKGNTSRILDRSCADWKAHKNLHR